MTTEQQNLFPWGEFLLIIGLVLILIGVNCTKGCAQSFNHRDFQFGNFKVTYDTDSIYISEQFVYEESGYKYNWKNSFAESITVTCEGQMYKDIYTEQNHYVLLYCREDYHDFQICDVYVHPVIGETLYYYNK